MTLYGYRYTPGGMVIELRGLGYSAAADAVIARRNEQGRRNNTPTAELVEQDGGEWRFVPLPDGGDQ